MPNLFTELENQNKQVPLAELLRPKTLEEFSKKHPDVPIVKINVEDEEEKATAWGVRNLPSVFLIDDTIQDTEPNFIRKFVGVKSLKDLEKFVYDVWKTETLK